MRIAQLSILFCLTLSVFSAVAQSNVRTDVNQYDGIDKPLDHFTDIKWDYFLYPVPAVDEITIKITKGSMTINQINITNEFGVDMLELIDLTTEKIKIDVSSLPEGQYILQVIPDDKSSVKMKRFYVDR
jgi:hypothetical protein